MNVAFAAKSSGTALERITALVAQRTGAALSTVQIARLSAEVLRRLCASGRLRPGEPMEEADLEHYLSALRNPRNTAELGLLLASIAVHKTDLFRDAGQLEAFRAHVLGPLVMRETRPVRLWSAGCATGEEVATLLLMLADSGAHPQSTVLGTDLSDRALTQAKSLTFRADVLPRVPIGSAAAHVLRQGDTFTLSASLRARASFAVHNLMDEPYPAPPEGAFDVIFCRNVLIYFTTEALVRVVEALAYALRPGGTLVLSAAEPLLDEHPLLETIRLEDAFFYRRRAAFSLPDPLLQRARSRYTPAPLERPMRADLTALTPIPARELRASEPPSRPISWTPAPIPAPLAVPPAEDADARFEALLESSARGAPPDETERELRECLYLDPHFAQARYLLAMLLEQRGARADAASEYRRALAALRDGKARFHPFFLNRDRLQHACHRALERVGFPQKPEGLADRLT